jgi:phosphoglycerate dehydrogenase-like enzyme
MTQETAVLIASYLEPEHVERIAAIPGIDVIYEPALLPPPLYQADHHFGAAAFRRSPEDERRWRGYLSRAEVMFDFDHTHPGELLQLAPRLKWVQATSAGIGEALARWGYLDSAVVFTTAGGVHGTPLAEFCLWAMLAFAKDAFRMAREKSVRHWERYCGRQLRGTTVGIVGLGRIGREIARSCRALGMRVIATKRTAPPEPDPDVDEMVPISELPTLLRAVDTLILSTPRTPETVGLIGEREIRTLPRGALLINVARGAVVDEPAMIAALRDGHLRGAALDVFAKEPLPPDSPLWDMPNVIVSPHSASTVDTENAKLTDLFCENLGRYLRGDPLLNVFDRERFY